MDLGTGCGAVALSLLLARPEARAVATDVSRVALSFAARNAVSLGVAERVRFVRSDWLRAFRRGPWATLVVSNPPYVGDDEPLPADVSDHEPSGALFAGPDGLRDIRRLLDDAPGVLLPGGGSSSRSDGRRRMPCERSSAMRPRTGGTCACRRISRDATGSSP